MDEKQHLEAVHKWIDRHEKHIYNLYMHLDMLYFLAAIPIYYSLITLKSKDLYSIVSVASLSLLFINCAMHVLVAIGYTKILCNQYRMYLDGLLTADEVKSRTYKGNSLSLFFTVSSFAYFLIGIYFSATHYITR